MEELASTKVGRKTVITEAVVRKLECILQLGVSDALACQYAKISRDTLYNHIKSDPEFSDRIESAKQYAVIAAAQVVVNAIRKNDVRAAQWWLERKLPEEFGDRKAEKRPTLNIFNNPEFIKRYAA